MCVTFVSHSHVTLVVSCFTLESTAFALSSPPSAKLRVLASQPTISNPFVVTVRCRVVAC
eukprot:m.8017 g.8017  ORF g.8017 m.8017 type:complete len:60 (+) comp5311_c0_seq1:2445-2624(+)